VSKKITDHAFRPCSNPMHTDCDKCRKCWQPHAAHATKFITDHKFVPPEVLDSCRAVIGEVDAGDGDVMVDCCRQPRAAHATPDTDDAALVAEARDAALEEAAVVADLIAGLLHNDAGYCARLNHVGMTKHVALAIRSLKSKEKP